MRKSPIIIAILFAHLVDSIKTYVEIPENVQLNGTTYSISAFSPKAFVKSDEFQLNATQCIQYSFQLLERRVRLHAYTCQMSTGGFCTLDKFSFPDDRRGCTYLRPWTHQDDTWSFYFVLEKRARKYGKAYHLRHKSKRNTPKKVASLSAEPTGILDLYGIVPCSEACGNADQKLGSQADNTFHRPRSTRLSR